MEHQVTVLAGPASRTLGAAVCASLHARPGLFECRRFPDGETQIEVLESVRGHDVYLVQSTSPPVDQHLVELVLMADACRRAGASRLTAVIPYFGYARQDRRRGRCSLGAHVAATIVEAADVDRLMLVDAHTPTIEGFFDVPLDHLTAVPVLARAAAPAIGDRAVVVAPDLGAVKLARAYARELSVPMAFVHKTRVDGRTVQADAVIGDVFGRVPLIVDDMLSTGATIEAAVGALRAAGAHEPMGVAVTHAVLVGSAHETLARLPLSQVVVTDTIDVATPAPPRVEVCSVASLLATAIRRNHNDESLADLRASF